MRATKFAGFVQVYASDGQHLRRVPPAEAQRLIQGGAQVREERRGRVYEIVAPPTRARLCGPASPPRLTQYMGQRYTRVHEIRDGETVVGRVLELKRVRAVDRDLFLMSVRDCGGLAVDLVRRDGTVERRRVRPRGERLCQADAI